jgi:hypothetical protein
LFRLAVIPAGILPPELARPYPAALKIRLSFRLNGGLRICVNFSLVLTKKQIIDQLFMLFF